MGRVRKSTMVELVEELRKLPQTPKVLTMIEEALAGEYHDYKNDKYVCGKVASAGLLRQMGGPEHVALAKRIEEGEFDEQADAEDDKMLAGHMSDMIADIQHRKAIVRGTLMPRIRGNAYPIGKEWSYEVYVTIGPDTEENEPIVINFKDKRFLNQQSAIAALKIEAQNVADEVCKAMGVKHTGYMDLKENRYKDCLV